MGVLSGCVRDLSRGCLRVARALPTIPCHELRGLSGCGESVADELDNCGLEVMLPVVFARYLQHIADPQLPTA